MQSPQWWEKRKEPVAIDLDIPATGEAAKPKKVRRSCLLVLATIVIRLLGLAVAAGCIGLGAWICYQIPNDLSVPGITSQVAQGGFLCLAGLLFLIAELRTRWTMRGCMNTYILFGNYLARGFCYIFIGGLIFALNAQPPIIKLAWLAGGMIAVGGVNIIFYPIYWKYLRNKAFAKQTEQPKVAFPEEVVYGLDAYIPKANVPAAAPAATKAKVETAEPKAKEVDTTPEVVPAEPTKDSHTIDMPSLKGKEPMKTFDNEVVPEPAKAFGNEIVPEPIGAGAC